ncbi:MAG: SCO family protein [Bacteroidia bacterium]
MPRAWVPSVALVVVGGLFYGGVWLWERQLPSPKTPPLYEGLQSLHLQAPTEDTFSLNRLKGKIVLLNVFYSRCPSICPAMNAQLRQLWQVLPTDGSVVMVSISTDPGHDTGAVLAAFAQSYAAGHPWYFVRPQSEANLAVFAKEYLSQTVARLSENDFMHSDAVYLLDSQGRLRGTYTTRRPESMKQLIRHIQKLQSV